MNQTTSIPEGIVINNFDEIEASQNFKGLFIKKSSEMQYSRPNSFYIEGVCGLYVNPGAAMSTWEQFPERVIFHVKAVGTNNEYISKFIEASFSYDGEVNFGPSGQIVQKKIDRNLFDEDFFENITSLSAVLKPGTKIEISAEFEGMISNKIIMDLK